MRRSLRTAFTLTVLVILLLTIGHSDGFLPRGEGGAGAKASLQANQGLYVLNSSDPAVVPNTGASMEVTSFAMPQYVGNGSASFELSVDELVGSKIMAVGLMANSTLNGAVVQPFAAVFNSTSPNPPTSLSGVTAAIARAAPVGSRVDLAIGNSGGNQWTAYVNGTSILSADMGANQVTSPLNTFDTIGFTSNGAPWIPQKIFVPDLLSALTHSGWYLPRFANASLFSGNVASPIYFSEEQLNHSLYPGELIASTNASASSPSSRWPPVEIWAGTPTIQVSVNGTVSPSMPLGGKNASITWSVSKGGKPVAGVRLDFWSSAGGVVRELTTSASGLANSTLMTQPVNAPHLIYFNSTVLNNTYFGQGMTSMDVLPKGLVPLTVTVTAHGSPTSTVFSLVVRVTSNGTPITGVSLLPSASVGGGSFSPYAPWATNSKGYSYANYTPPTGATGVTVSVSVSRSGFSGTGTVNITVGPPKAPPSPPTGSNNYLIEDAIAGSVAAGGILVTLVWLYRKRSSKMGEGLDGLEPGGLVGGGKGEEEADRPKDAK